VSDSIIELEIEVDSDLYYGFTLVDPATERVLEGGKLELLSSLSFGGRRLR
jgi:hypothetical protein